MKRVVLIQCDSRFYEDPLIRPLSFAEEDGIALAGVFQHLAGYDQVVPLLAKDDATILDTAEKLCISLSPGDIFVFFAATHGIQVGGRLLLLTSRAKYSDLKFFRDVVPVDLLKQKTNRPGLQRIFILDVCRSEMRSDRDAGGGVFHGVDALKRDIAAGPVSDPAPAPLTILCSCDEGCQALEHPRLRRGLFSLALQQEMEEAHRHGVELRVTEDLKRRLGKRMVALAKAAGLPLGQRPWLQSSADAPLVLLLGRDVPAAPSSDRAKEETLRIRLHRWVEDRKGSWSEQDLEDLKGVLRDDLAKIGLEELDFVRWLEEVKNARSSARPKQIQSGAIKEFVPSRWRPTVIECVILVFLLGTAAVGVRSWLSRWGGGRVRSVLIHQRVADESESAFVSNVASNKMQTEPEETTSMEMLKKPSVTMFSISSSNSSVGDIQAAKSTKQTNRSDDQDNFVQITPELRALAFFETFTNTCVWNQFEVSSGINANQLLLLTPELISPLVTNAGSIYALCSAPSIIESVLRSASNASSARGSLRRGTNSSVIDSILFARNDPRMFLLSFKSPASEFLQYPVCTIRPQLTGGEQVILISANGQSCALYDVAKDVRFPRHMTIKHDTFSEIVGGVRPVKGDFVFTINGELVGIMVNEDHCVQLETLEASETLELGSSFSRLERRLELIRNVESCLKNMRAEGL